MNREILFRGKRADNGEWIEGFYSIDTICCKGDFYLAPVIRKKPQKLFDTDWDEVIPSTAGQYTGLTDKNGRKIFEGDIVNVKTISGSFINYVITWFNSDLCWVMQSLKDTSVRFRLRSCWEFEVVDNIHDNPELLKGEPNV